MPSWWSFWSKLNIQLKKATISFLRMKLIIMHLQVTIIFKILMETVVSSFAPLLVSFWMRMWVVRTVCIVKTINIDVYQILKEACANSKDVPDFCKFIGIIPRNLKQNKGFRTLSIVSNISTKFDGTVSIWNRSCLQLIKGDLCALNTLNFRLIFMRSINL